MMTAREACDAMADHFEQELSTSRSVYPGLREDEFNENGVVIVKPMAVRMLVNNLRMLRDMLPTSDQLADEAGAIFGQEAAAQIIELQKHRKT